LQSFGATAQMSEGGWHANSSLLLQHTHVDRGMP
jgi:hypothetical protein